MKRVYQTPKLEIFEYSTKVNLLQYSGEKGLLKSGPKCDNDDCFELGFMNIPGQNPHV